MVIPHQSFSIFILLLIVGEVVAGVLVARSGSPIWLKLGRRLSRAGCGQALESSLEKPTSTLHPPAGE